MSEGSPHSVPSLLAGLGDSEREIAAADEILQILYWLRGEGFSEDSSAEQVAQLVGLDEAEVNHLLDRLLSHGLVTATERGSDEPSFVLTDLGIAEGGRRFADEFDGLTSQAHGECNDPDCLCMATGDPADCAHHAHG